MEILRTSVNTLSPKNLSVNPKVLKKTKVVAISTKIGLVMIKGLSVCLSLSVLSSSYAFAGSYYLKEETIAKAQAGFSEVQEWDCGPRTISTCLSMLDSTPQDIPHFINSSPKTLGYPQCPETKSLQKELEEQVPLVAMFLPNVGKVGPYASCLAAYAQKAQNRFDVFAEKTEDFDSTLQIIVNEIKEDRPVIVKIHPGGFLLHYIIVIGIDEDEKEVQILNSEDGSEEIYTFEQLETEMNITAYRNKLVSLVSLLNGVSNTIRSHPVISEILSGYNLIHFSPKRNVESCDPLANKESV